MRFARGLLASGLALGVLLSACGSGGGPEQQDGEPVSTGTVRSEREGREASIMQQQESAAEAGQSEQAEPVDVDAPGVIDFGHREGLPFTRNVVGDPEAPVLIVEYSDFQ